MKPFRVDALLETARARAGLDDFGPDDFLEPLAILVDAFNGEAAIRDDRAGMLHEHLLRLLVNRLWFAKDQADHPEMRDEDLGSPAVMASLPRTGSTKLHRLLGASGDFQYLTYWKVHMPARIPGAADGGIARRIAQTREYERWMYATSPGILTGHPLFTDEAEEDQWLIEGTFRHPLLYGLFDSGRYLQWIMRADMKPTFDYFVSLLKYLQWQSPAERGKPWLLKTPNHMGNEAHLTGIFERPRFIVTHRDPVTCIPSVTSAAMASRRLYSDRDSSAEMAIGNIQLFAHVAHEHVRWREANPQVAVLDLSFRDINADGVAAANKVYDFLGMTMSAAAETRMREWERKNGRDTHGKAEYSSQAYGLDEDRLREAFAAYRERFADYL